MYKPIALCLSALVLFPGVANSQNNSQNKVVVIPLGGDDSQPDGVDFSNGTSSINISNITTCGSRTLLKGVTITVPKSKTESFVICRATGRTFHSQTGKWVFYSIDDAAGTGNDVFAYTGVQATSTYANYAPFAMQEVYTFPPEGGLDTYYLKACRQDTDTSGTAYHDDFTCEVHLERF